MAGKVLVEVPNPLTQDTKAVVALLKCLGRAYSPLPDAVKLPDMALVLSSKKDVFYTVTARDCSCPARTYHPGQACKHMKRFFPGTSEKPAPSKVEEAKVKVAEARHEARQHQTRMKLNKNLVKLGKVEPVDSIMPSMVGFKPVLE